MSFRIIMARLNNNRIIHFDEVTILFWFCRVSVDKITYKGICILNALQAQ